MNGAEQLEMAEKLRVALEHAGIRVEKRMMASGRVTGHETVPAVIVLGAIIARGWVVSLDHAGGGRKPSAKIAGETPAEGASPGAETPPANRARGPLHLIRSDGHRDGREL